MSPGDALTSASTQAALPGSGYQSLQACFMPLCPLGLCAGHSSSPGPRPEHFVGLLASRHDFPSASLL